MLAGVGARLWRAGYGMSGEREALDASHKWLDAVL